MKERRRNARVGLLGHGHREFRTLGDAVGPALHDALVARVKAHSFLAEIFRLRRIRSNVVFATCHQERGSSRPNCSSCWPLSRHSIERGVLSVSTGNGMAAKKMNAESSTRLRELR
jgi:hypothetical protein